MTTSTTVRLTALQLSIHSPDSTIAFYRDILGMRLIECIDSDESSIYQLQFEDCNTSLSLIHEKNSPADKPLSKHYQHKKNDHYWKYSIFVDDIERVCDALRNNNHAVSEAHQFGDIGYLAHTMDSEQHHIELIQKNFKQHTRPIEAKPQYPLLESPVMGLITIRSKDPLASIRFYETFFQMKLLVRMYVEGFTLYFLGNADLQAPNHNTDAIENREWMYQQNELFIEIQHYWGSEYDESFVLESNIPFGCKAIAFTHNNMDEMKSSLSRYGIAFHTNTDTTISVISPDMHSITVSGDKHSI